MSNKELDEILSHYKEIHSLVGYTVSCSKNDYVAYVKRGKKIVYKSREYYNPNDCVSNLLDKLAELTGGNKLAKVIANKTQLKSVGIDEDLTDKVVTAFDIDKYNGIGGKCSRIVADTQFEWLSEKGINADYLIPTKWLEFI